MKRLILALAFAFAIGLSSILSVPVTNAWSNDNAVAAQGSYQTVAYHRHHRHYRHHRHWHHRGYAHYGYHDPYYPYYTYNYGYYYEPGLSIYIR